MQNQRRNFLKMTAAGAAGLALAKADKVFAATTAWPATGTMEINPNINNLRVVCMYDPAMITNANLTNFSLSSYVGATSKTVIADDMDMMAMSLAQKTAADTAWNTIFQKPTAKTWAQVMVAIKVNGCNPRNLPRLAVVDKICRVLNGFGVPGANIIVYDGAINTCNSMNSYSPYFSTTGSGTYNGYAMIPGVATSGSSKLGGTVNTAIPNNPKGGSSQACPAYLANGTVDILVNIAVNKGHTTPTNGGVSQGNTGGCTLCLKNHFGTFPAAVNHNNANPSTGDNAVYMNMSDAIIGGTPPRQQLCIVDSLWADHANTPDSGPTEVLSRLVMGTFAGAVDYLTCVKIRRDIQVTQMGLTNNMDFTQINRFLTLFGYTTTDPALTWVPITPNTGVFPGATNQSAHHGLEVAPAGSLKGSSVHFSIPASVGLVGVDIFDVRGREVRGFSTISFSEKVTIIRWDGKSKSGGMCPAGTYIIKVSAAGFEQTERMSITG